MSDTKNVSQGIFGLYMFIFQDQGGEQEICFGLRSANPKYYLHDDPRGHMYLFRGKCEPPPYEGTVPRAIEGGVMLALADHAHRSRLSVGDWVFDQFNAFRCVFLPTWKEVEPFTQMDSAEIAMSGRFCIAKDGAHPTVKLGEYRFPASSGQSLLERVHPYQVPDPVIQVAYAHKFVSSVNEVGLVHFFDDGKSIRTAPVGSRASTIKIDEIHPSDRENVFRAHRDSLPIRLTRNWDEDEYHVSLV